MRFAKYQALGNDYLIVEGVSASALTPSTISRICNRHFGVGSDGVLIETRPESGAAFALRILNPDGSEAEKSGNGLRIFARYLWDSGRVGPAPFTVATKGGQVECQVRAGGREVFVRMGTATFDSAMVPIAGPRREVVGETVDIDGEAVRFSGVGIGNPHCVVHVDETSSALAQLLGPRLETHPLFPNRTNVQFVHVLDRGRIRIEIWERGAGYTLASGSSACAAAAASVRLGLCDGDVTVLMPGGSLRIGVGADYAVTMLGGVGKVAEGELADELLADAGSPGARLLP